MKRSVRLSDMRSREYRMLLLVAFAGSTLMCVLLGGCDLDSGNRSAQSKTTPASQTPTPVSGKWLIRTDVSPMDDSRTVALFLEAENEISGWLETKRPVLILRCLENKTTAYINVGMSANVEYGHQGATVRVRFDSKDPRKLVMDRSTDDEALFFREPISVIREMMVHEVMIFEFTPFNASPARATFKLTGLKEAIKPLQEACHWQ